MVISIISISNENLSHMEIKLVLYRVYAMELWINYFILQHLDPNFQIEEINLFFILKNVIKL